MPLVHVNMPTRRFETSKKMPTPKKMANIENWFKDARKVIPEIPDPKVTDWFLKTSHAHPDYVKFEIVNSIGEQGTVFIDRTYKTIGAF